MSVVEEPECRICLQPGADAGDPLVPPCHCEGSVGLCHYSCLKHWAVEAGSLTCELCKHEYCEPYLSQLRQEVLLRHRERRMALEYSVPVSPPAPPTTQAENVGALVQSVLCHVISIIILVGLTIYMTTYSGWADTLNSSWPAILWRVLMGLIITYCVVRCGVVIFMWYRSAGELRRQREAERAARLRPVLERIMTDSQTRASRGVHRPHRTLIVARRATDGGPVLVALAHVYLHNPSHEDEAAAGGRPQSDAIGVGGDTHVNSPRAALPVGLSRTHSVSTVSLVSPDPLEPSEAGTSTSTPQHATSMIPSHAAIDAAVDHTAVSAAHHVEPDSPQACNHHQIALHGDGLHDKRPQQPVAACGADAASAFGGFAQHAGMCGGGEPTHADMSAMASSSHPTGRCGLTGMGTGGQAEHSEPHTQAADVPSAGKQGSQSQYVGSHSDECGQGQHSRAHVTLHVEAC